MYSSLFSFCLAASIGMPSDYTYYPEGGEVVIILNESPGKVTGTPHRAPAQIPISGYVDTTVGVVFLSFSSPCGT